MAICDVFISFKNSDEERRPTRDGRLAAEVYHALEARGFHVFLSNISLEKLGTGAFKKAIDEALDAASVLVAICSRPDHLDSPWVRYECDSFVVDINSRRKPHGQIFTYLEGLRPDQLPAGFRHIQSFPHEAPDTLEKLGNFVKSVLGTTPTLQGGRRPDEEAGPKGEELLMDDLDWLMAQRQAIREMNARIGNKINMPWSPEISVWFGMIGVAVADAWNAGKATVRSDEIREMVGKFLEFDYGITREQWEEALRCYYIPAKEGNELNFLLITPRRHMYAVNEPWLAASWDASSVFSAFRTIYPAPERLREPSEGREREWCDWLRREVAQA
jgi:hypothetical protein